MEKIWLNSYPQGVPYEINPDQYSSLVDLLTSNMEKYHNLPAFSNYNTVMSYGTLDKLSKNQIIYTNVYIIARKR